jgi:hypothetical protein
MRGDPLSVRGRPETTSSSGGGPQMRRTRPLRRARGRQETSLWRRRGPIGAPRHSGLGLEGQSVFAEGRELKREVEAPPGGRGEAGLDRREHVFVRLGTGSDGTQAGEQQGTTARIDAPGLPATAGSVEALDAPGAGGVACEHEPHTIVGPGGDKVSSVLLHAGAIVDEDKIERRRLEPWAMLAERLPGGCIDQRAVPAAIGGPGLLERVVGLPDALLPAGLLAAPVRDDVPAR